MTSSEFRAWLDEKWDSRQYPWDIAARDTWYPMIAMIRQVVLGACDRAMVPAAKRKQIERWMEGHVREGIGMALDAGVPVTNSTHRSCCFLR